MAGARNENFYFVNLFMNNSPIGVLDSGSGGLSIYLSLRHLLPNESIFYVGDHAYNPYGDKSTEFIQDRVIKLARYLVDSGCKLIVIACNTATIAGIDHVRKEFPQIPIIGVVPVIKTAALESKTKHFIVLSTNFTADSGYQRQLIQTFASGCTVTSVGSARLVTLIEEGQLDTEEVRAELHHVFDRIKRDSYDVVVLGCTHFPFVRSAIRDMVGPGIQIFDSGDAVARHATRILTQMNMLSLSSHPSQTFVTTGDSTKVAVLFERLLDKKVEVSHVAI